LILSVSCPWQCLVHFLLGRSLNSYKTTSLVSLLLTPSFKLPLFPHTSSHNSQVLSAAMDSYALSLYKASSSIYDLDVAPLSVDYTPKSSYVREEARLITETPLAIMPPSSYMSGGSSIKSMARSNMPKGGAKEKKKAPACPTTSAIGLKRKAPVSSESSKHTNVTPSSNSVSQASSSIPSTRPSPSYTMVGVRKPDGGYGKALMRKTAKKPVSEPAPSGKGSESLGLPLRIKRFRKLPPIRCPAR
jgi:hypothetical protein